MATKKKAEPEEEKGIPDFTRAMKGTRHGRMKINKRDFDILVQRVMALEAEVFGSKEANLRQPEKPPAKKNVRTKTEG